VGLPNPAFTTGVGRVKGEATSSLLDQQIQHAAAPLPRPPDLG